MIADRPAFDHVQELIWLVYGSKRYRVGSAAQIGPASTGQSGDCKQCIAKTPETMPLNVQSFGITIVCDGDELQTYDVKQEGPNSITAFVASEAGKVSSVPQNPLREHEEYQLSRSAIQLHAQ